ncbi:PilW family protein [Teredinibacter purpureus]|uniref:PilW family protein n=1 Tax=Teredinibacter purpureus TaxID=2731756 RepID=UPI0005F7FF65|nr:PilW family protein [Teredinibacter purpureus]
MHLTTKTLSTLQRGLEEQRGVSIVEVMVSILVGLFILAGVIQLYATSSQNSVLISGSSTIQENARYVFSRLASDVAQAGYGGCFSISARSALGVTRFKSVVSGNSGSGDIYDFSEFISGTNDTVLNDLTFDSVTVRYASTRERHPVKSFAGTTIKIVNSRSFKQGQIALVSDCSRTAMFKVSNAPGGSGDVNFALEQDSVTYNSDTDLGFEPVGFEDINTVTPGIPVSFVLGGTTGSAIYHVDTSAAGVVANVECSSTAPQYCALFRQTGTNGKGDELVEGVERFDVEFGWQTYSGNDDTLFFADASGVGANWSLVDRIKVTAVFNSVNRAPTNVGSDFIDRTYTRVFSLRNQFPGDADLRNSP